MCLRYFVFFRLLKGLVFAFFFSEINTPSNNDEDLGGPDVCEDQKSLGGTGVSEDLVCQGSVGFFLPRCADCCTSFGATSMKTTRRS